MIFFSQVQMWTLLKHSTMAERNGKKTTTHTRGEKHHGGVSNPWLSKAFQAIRLAFDLSAFSLQIALQVFS